MQKKSFIKLFLSIALISFFSNSFAQKEIKELREPLLDSLEHIKITELLQDTINLNRFCDSLLTDNVEPTKDLQWFNEFADQLIKMRQFDLGEDMLFKGQQHFVNYKDSLNIEFLYSLYLQTRSNHLKQNYAANIPVLSRLHTLLKNYNNDYLILRNLANLAKYSFGMGDMENGIPFFKEALNKAEYSNNYRIIYDLYLDLGNRMNFYEPELGIDLLEHAGYYHEKYLKTKFDLSSYYYLALGMLYLGVDQETGYNKFEESLHAFRLGEELNKNPTNFLFDVYFNYYFGYCNQMLHNYDTAIFYFDECKQLFEDSGETSNPLYGKALSLKGVTYLKSERFDSAEYYFESAYPHLVKAYGANNAYHTLENQNYLSNVLLELNKNTQALKTISNVIKIISNAKDSIGIYELPKIENIEDESLIAYKNALYYKIMVLKQMQADTQIIINHYKELFQTFYLSAAKKTNENSVFVQISNLNEYRDSMFYLVGDNSIKSNYKIAVWEMFANIKSYGLRTLANRTNDNLSDSVYFNLLEIQNDIKLIENRLSDEYEELKNKVIKYKIDYFVQKFNQPESELIIETPKTNFKEIKKRLKSTDLIVDYYLSEKTLVYFTLFNNEFNVYSIAIPDGFKKSVRKLSRDIRTGNCLDEKITKMISDLLFGEIYNSIEFAENIIVIPDGELWQVPFEMLPLPNNEQLVQSKNVSYLYAASHLNSTGNYSSPSVMLVAPGFTKNNQPLVADVTRSSIDFKKVLSGEKSLEPLVNSIIECKTIGNYCTQNNIANVVLLNEKATKKSIIKSINNYSIAHFATHGISDKSDYWNSGVFLKSNNEKLEFLSLSEIFTNKIGLDLAVLSACKTAYGEVLVGEGPVALPRGFIAAGTKNVIASLWKVHDEKTKDLMVAFYKHLLENKVSYAEALRLAKLDCIKKGFLPMDWAGFVLIGN